MYQLTFVLNFLLVVLLMKALAAGLYYQKHQAWPKVFWIRSPLLTPRGIKRLSLTHYSSYRILGKLFLSLTGFLLWVEIFHYSFEAPYSWIELIILAPSVYFLTQVMGYSAQCLYALTGVIPEDIHYHPYLSKTLAEFWGRRWNRWVRDWLNYLSTHWSSKQRWKGLGIAFLLSGAFHELMFNLPYWLYYRENYFGTMMAYFSLQGIGFGIQKSILKSAPLWLHRLWLWLIVMVFSPLFLQPPFLHFIGLKP